MRSAPVIPPVIRSKGRFPFRIEGTCIDFPFARHDLKRGHRTSIDKVRFEVKLRAQFFLSWRFRNAHSALFWRQRGLFTSAYLFPPRRAHRDVVLITANLVADVTEGSNPAVRSWSCERPESAHFRHCQMD